MGDKNALPGLSRLRQTVAKLKSRGASVVVKSLVRLNYDQRENSCRLNDVALRSLAQRLDLSVARTELRARAAWRTAITQDVPLVLLDQSDKGTCEAQSDLHRLARELWPEIGFPYPSEIRAGRAAQWTARKAVA